MIFFFIPTKWVKLWAFLQHILFMRNSIPQPVNFLVFPNFYDLHTERINSLFAWVNFWKIATMRMWNFHRWIICIPKIFNEKRDCNLQISSLNIYSWQHWWAYYRRFRHIPPYYSTNGNSYRVLNLNNFY